MRIELALQIGMAVMSCLGTLMLGMGEQSLTLPVLAAIVAASSVWLTDVKGWLRLNRRLADGFGLAALVYSAWDFLDAAPESQLLIVANLMVYLQFILQYQAKTVRSYWLLALLSLMQAAVSTALNLDLQYGGLMLLYAVSAMVTMALFLLFREGQRLDPARRQRRAQSETAYEPESATQAATALPLAASAGRWPLAAVEVAFAPRVASDAGLEVDRGLFLNVGRVVAPSLALAGVLFAFIPRLGRTEWEPPTLYAEAQVGFTEQVQLGSLGPIVENPAGVMRVRFKEYQTGEDYPIVGETLFRGVVLNRYRGGSWQLEPPGDTEVWDDPPEGTELVEQEITIEPSDSDVVFSIYPLAEVLEQRDVLYDRRNQRLVRREEVQHSQLTYRVVTAGLMKGAQTLCIPEAQAPGPEGDLLPLTPPDGPNPLAGLRQRAAELVAGIDPALPDARYRQVRALENYFRASGEFQYSLNPTRTDTALDPVEDFLLNMKAGHCEYFASALVLMLRSVKIKARMVVGYKGGDWNDLGGYLLVRQLHAHAWVEAYLDRRELPAALVAGLPPTHGVWLRLDPTPGVVGEELASSSGVIWPLLQQSSDYAQFLWAHYVMGMDARRQEEAIYLPLVNATGNLIEWLRNPRTWAALYDAFVEFPRVLRQEIASGNYFNWRLILVLVVGLALLLSATWIGRIGGRRVWRWWERSTGAAYHPERAAVEFYRRLEQLLARRRMERAASQTQHEFAQAAEHELQAAGLAPATSAVPHRVVDAFYRVRFGREALDKDEAEAVEIALADLERALDAP